MKASIALAALAGAVVVAAWTWRADQAGPTRSSPEVPMTAASTEVRAPTLPASSLPAPPASEPSRSAAVGQGLWPPDMGSEGFAPHIQRNIDAGRPETLALAFRQLSLCHKPEVLDELSDSARTQQWGGPVVAKFVLERFASGKRACQTVTPELLAQRKAIAERLVAAHWPGAVRDYEAALDKPPKARWAPEVAAQLAEWHRAAAQRGDEASWTALARWGSLYGLDKVESRAWGDLIQRCQPDGLREGRGGQQRTPFHHIESDPAIVKAFADRGFVHPPEDPKVVAAAQALATSWPCPPSPP